MLTAMTAVDNIIAGRTDKVEHLGREHRDGLPRGPLRARGNQRTRRGSRRHARVGLTSFQYMQA